MWVFAEYAASPANTWGTWFGQLTFGGTSSTPTLSVSPSSQDFGSVTVGSSVDRTFTVSNTGGGTLTGSATISAPFSIVSGGSFSLGAGQSQTVTVRFSPTAAGIFGGTVSFSSNGGSASATVPGTGSTGASSTEVPGGGLTPSSPAAVVEGSTLHLFVRGTDDRLYLNTRSGGSFGGWTEVPGGGRTPSQPAAVLDSNGNLRLYVRGTDNRIYVNVRTGSTWSGWSEVPGGGLTSSGPEAVLDGSQVRLFVQGVDNRIYTITL